MATLDKSITALAIEPLGDQVRAHYRAALAQSIAAGHRQPLVFPWGILAAFIVPTLWLTVPHTSGWLRRANWVVVAFVVVFNLRLVWSTGSPNFACGYGTGLMAAWGIISTLTLLVWTSPQEGAARIVRRKRSSRKKSDDATVANGAGENSDASQSEDLRGTRENGVRRRNAPETSPTRPGPGTPEHEPEYDYIWQPFPANSSWSSRLNWAFDLTTNFRFTGWNWSISVIPRPKIDFDVLSDETTRVDLESMPVETKAGYRRSLTLSDFVSSRITNVIVTYLALDFLAVAMMKDPYFVLGPDISYPLPGYLAVLPKFFLHSYRLIFSLMGVLFAIFGVLSLNDLAQYYVVSYIIPIRGELWQHPSTMGSYTQILDRGLAGWWGAWWHQTFRMQFIAPAAWLTKKGYIQKGTLKGTVVTLLATFLGSGFLHVWGSVSSLPATKVWRAPVFFLLQAFGIVGQHALSLGARRAWPSMPRWLARACNLGSTLAWMYFTAHLFTDDMASSGIWLLEPVPFSLFRALGLGHPGDSWRRWDQYHRLTWYTAEQWWRSGITI